VFNSWVGDGQVQVKWWWDFVTEQSAWCQAAGVPEQVSNCNCYQTLVMDVSHLRDVVIY
jgi:hypothetical protein